MNRIDRIRQMELRMEQVAQWIERVAIALEQYPSVREGVFELSSYYESDLWMEDYEADEAGKLPKDLERGVLSEDGLYNLLAEYVNLTRGLRKIGEGETR